MDQDYINQASRRNHYTDAQVGDTKGLFNSLKWIDGSRLKKKTQEAITTQMPKVRDAKGLFKSLKWIDGSKARPKTQSLYRCPGWGYRRSLQVTNVDRWIQIKEQDPRSNHYTGAQVGNAEGLFKLLQGIDGSRLKKARPKNQSLYQWAGWGHQRSLQVTKMDRWIKII